MRFALVTGGTKNIGLAVATALIDAGTAVAINGRNPVAVRETVDRLRSQGATVMEAPADIANEDEVRDMVACVRAEWGRIDIVVNNAGLRCHGPLATTSLSDWQSVIDTVLTGSFLVTREVFAGMCEQGWGRIVNLSGLSAQTGASGRVAVVAAKSGIIGLTKAAASEGAEHGVTVNAISPGLIDTDRSPTLGDEAFAAEHYQKTAKIPVGRLGTPDDIGRLCAFLCAEDAGFITGQTYSVNGGVHM